MVARSHLVPIALAIALATGCASLPGGAEFDLRSARIVANTSEDPIVPPGTHGKGTSAAAGAGGGLAAGVALGVVPCLLMGPFAGACVAAMGPAIAVTAAGTAAYAAANADTAEHLAAKRELLRAALVPKQAHAQLATELTSLVGAAPAPQAVAAPSSAGAGSAQRAGQQRWEIRVAVKSVDAAGPGIDVPFALAVAAVMEVHDPSAPAGPIRKGYLNPVESQLARESPRDAPTPTRTTLYQAKTDARFTLAQWAAEDGAPVKAAVEATLRQLASKMVNDLTRPTREASENADAAQRPVVDPTGVRGWSRTGVTPAQR